jgi:hypothetical protein
VLERFKDFVVEQRAAAGLAQQLGQAKQFRNDEQQRGDRLTDCVTCNDTSGIETSVSPFSICTT